MYLKGIKSCCALAFATVLAMPSKISEEQCLKRIPDLVRNRTVLLRLGSDNSCPVEILRGRSGWAMPPQIFVRPPQFFCNFPFKFIWMTYTVDNFRPAIF